MNVSKTHPYELNSNAYNFFFHPLHKSEENPLKAIIAVIVNIAITIFSFFLWQIPFWIVNRLDHKKIENLNPNTNANSVVNEILGTHVKVSLDKIGGFDNGGNTCYIAATLQSLRQIPMFRRRLSSEYSLTQKPNESNEAFALRQKVKQTMFDFLNQTDAGKKVGGKDFLQYNALLDEYQQAEKLSECRSFLTGEGGDQGQLFSFIMRVMEFGGHDWDKLMYMKKEDCPGRYNCVDDDTKIADLFEFNLSGAPKIILIERIHPEAVKVAKNPDHVQSNVTLSLSKDIPVKIEYTHRDPQGREKSKHTYTLISATVGSRSHTVACLKEVGKPEGWVCCNDGDVKRVKDIPSFEAAHYLYYAELD